MPAESMTQEDIELLMGAVNAALEASPDQTTTQWKNPKTQAHGDITPVGSFEKSGRQCRKLEVANTARGRSNRVVVSFCRQADGQWKVEPD
jgi:surface antigen